MTEKVQQLIQQQISLGRDNLARARHAATWNDPYGEYGQSGRSLSEIIKGYEDSVSEWERELSGVAPLARPQ